MSHAPRLTVPLPTGAGATPPKSRPPYRAARAFYLTLLIGACFALYAFSIQPQLGLYQHGRHELYTRDTPVNPLLNDEERCRMVHRSKHQCSFVKKHCPQDEAGFAAYLDLYYCKLADVKPVAFIILISWLGLLFSTIGIAASDFFCINLSTLAAILGMSESMAGVTFLAFGNGSPDVFSTFAAMSTNSGSLAVGELFGAAGFITAVVAGTMALIRPFQVVKKSFIRDVSFFVVAAAFSMFFLWDGRLHFWECAAMVGYYVFYVMFVVVWHWWLGKRRKRREIEAAARGHYAATGEELETEQNAYHDHAEDGPGPSRTGTLGTEDWSALERGDKPYDELGYEDEEEAARERWMTELSSNMRLTRPVRSRRNTVTPVRPSLVGALEFQAVLKSLQKSRNIQTIPLIARRYTDDPTFTTLQQQDQFSAPDEPVERPILKLNVEENVPPTLEMATLDVPRSAPARARAGSVNDVHNMEIDSDFHRSSPSRRSLGQSGDLELGPPAINVVAAHSQPSHAETSSLQVSPTPDGPSFTPPSRVGSSSSGRLLAPPGQSPDFRSKDDPVVPKSILRKPTDSLPSTPQTVPMAKDLLKIVIPGRDPILSSSTARFHQSPEPLSSGPPSIFLPDAAMNDEPTVAGQDSESPRALRFHRWWPYSIMPPPGVIIATLFPTIYHWHEKTWWEKLLGVVAAPSVFLLTITLPVVENEKDNESSGGGRDRNDYHLDSASKSSTIVPYRDEPEAVSQTETAQDQPIHPAGTSGHPDLAGPASTATKPPPALTQELWNRWLTIIHLFLSPLLVILAIYSQSPTPLGPTWLLKPCLVSLLISTLVLIPVLLTTTPTTRPQPYRIFLSLAGFTVSIAWISTIAAQVVGALKALAVVLNMSHAIMGLTIFAVGNSLGDLVADVTIARLGYPVMALSACLGGPMLNILLGIGLSGSWILLRGARHRQEKHPDKGIHFKTFEIEVSDTLLVSGATLLVTLLGLLVAVPWNRWVMSKRIGWALIALWTLSTIGNVVIEIVGLPDWKGRES